MRAEIRAEKNRSDIYELDKIWQMGNGFYKKFAETDLEVVSASRSV